MSAHLSRLRLFQRHLWSLGCAWVWVWDFIHCHTSLRTRSPSSRHPPFTHYPFPPRSLVCGGQPSPHKPRLVVSHSTCPPLSSSPHAHSFVIGPAVINTHSMRSRSLVSTSNSALASCPDAKGEGHTHVERCVALLVCKLQRCCHNMLCFEVGDGFDVKRSCRLSAMRWKSWSLVPSKYKSLPDTLSPLESRGSLGASTSRSPCLN